VKDLRMVPFVGFIYDMLWPTVCMDHSPDVNLRRQLMSRTVL
jgi:hypothetical protein